MDKFDLLEKVVHTTGVSYEDAKNALEACEWDALEAVIYLEKEGEIEKKGSAFNTEAPKVNAHVRNTVNNNGTAQSFLHKAGNLLFHTRLVFTNRTGDDKVSIPLFAAVILFLVAFWICLLVFLFFLLIGYQPSIMTDNSEDNEKIRGTLNQTKENISSWVSSSLNRAADAIKPKTKPADPCEKTDSHPAEVLTKEDEETTKETTEKKCDKDPIEKEAKITDFSDTIEDVAKKIQDKAVDAEAVFPKDILDETNSEENSSNPEI